MSIIVIVEQDKRGSWTAWAKTYQSGFGGTYEEAIESFLMKLDWTKPGMERGYVEYFIDHVKVNPRP